MKAPKCFRKFWLYILALKILSSFPFLLVLFFFVTPAQSAPHAHIVLDAKTGEVLNEENADTRLHPAGLTKLLSLYAAFEAIDTGLIGLEDRARISLKAQSEPPVALGLREGQRVSTSVLLKAVGVQGANDASTALAEAIDGSEAAFARRMNSHSKELGLTRSTWKNAHGLTEKGHLSTARDIANLFIAHKRDFPNYFNLFSRITTDVGVREVTSSSRRLLLGIEGVTGAKYGYTRAASFNGAVYVQRGDKEVVAVVFGARSTKLLVQQLNLILEKLSE